jgi:hypothetical protein
MFEDWELVTELQPRGVDAFVQVSLRAHSDPGGSAASEEEALEWLWPVAKRLSRKTERPPMHAWRLGDSICAWTDFDWIEDGVAVKCYGLGLRDWRDCYILLTWIGEPDTLSYREKGRRIFDSIDRITRA